MHASSPNANAAGPKATLPAPLPASLVVSEYGSDWQPWFQAFKRSWQQVIVIEQPCDESLDVFAQRVRDSVSHLHDCHLRLDRAVMVCAGQPDEESMGLRAEMLRALSHELSVHGGGVVYLAGEREERMVLKALALTVEPLLEGTGVSVTHVDTPRRLRVPAARANKRETSSAPRTSAVVRRVARGGPVRASLPWAEVQFAMPRRPAR
ncbi:MAG: hypothetical protein ACPGUV_02365 [Polyangiales bacterium]